MKKQSPLQSVTADSHQKRLYSLTGIINIGLVTLILSIFVLAVTTYSKLKSFEESLILMTDESLPTVVHSGELYSQMSLLMSVTERLSGANSDAMRRIAYNAINQQLASLDDVAMDRSDNAYMLAQLRSIRRELADLNSLVEQKLTVNTLLNTQQDKLFTLHSNITDTATATVTNLANQPWYLAFSNVVARASEVLTTDQLSLIRQQQRTLSALLDKLDSLSQAQRTSKIQGASAISTQLRRMILNDKAGLIALRQSQLKIVGRVRGRGNFVRNLISDYARLNEFESHQLNESVLERAYDTSRLVTQQIQHISIIFVFVFLAYVAFVLFIHHAVVRRLKKLRNQVQQRAAGDSREIKMSGKDEMTELAHSFEQFASTIETQKATLEELSLRDALTGIANRRALDERYLQEIHVASRQRWPLSVMLLDVDFFKQYNDNYGHGQGDECLKQVAQLLKSTLPRKTDLLARYGGEEFAILLPDTDQAGAIRVAEAILNAFKEAQIPHDFSGVADHITISIGISVSKDVLGDHTIPSFDEADKSLYTAKRQGRNKWVMYDESIV